MFGMKKGMLNFTCLGNAARKCPTSCTYPYLSGTQKIKSNEGNLSNLVTMCREKIKQIK